MDKQEEIIVDGVTYIREDLMDAVIRQYRIERDEALEHICSPNERAFLDEIRENGEWMNSLKCLVVKKQDPNSHEQTGFLFQSDFTRSNLSELVEGKG